MTVNFQTLFNTSSGTIPASQAIGKTIYAGKKSVNLVRYPGGPVYATIPAGGLIGVVNSYLYSVQTGYQVFWEFLEPGGKSFYCAHSSELTIKEPTPQGSGGILDKVLNPFGFSDTSIGKTISTAAMTGLLIYGGSKAIEAIQRGTALKRLKRIF